MRKPIPHPLRAESLGTGIFPETSVATPRGWQAAADLRAGDVVLTVGAGPVALTGVVAQPVPLWVLHLPAGTLGNRASVRLAPGQAVLIDTDLTADAPNALVQAQALEGWRWVTAGPNADAPLALHMAVPELFYAGPGLMLATAGAVLPLAQARALVARVMAEELGLAYAAARGA